MVSAGAKKSGASAVAPPEGPPPPEPGSERELEVYDLALLDEVDTKRDLPTGPPPPVQLLSSASIDHETPAVAVVSPEPIETPVLSPSSVSIGDSGPESPIETELGLRPTDKDPVVVKIADPETAQVAFFEPDTMLDEEVGVGSASAPQQPRADAEPKQVLTCADRC